MRYNQLVDFRGAESQVLWAGPDELLPIDFLPVLKIRVASI